MNKRIIHTVFENQVTRTPANIAVTEGNKQLSYMELNQAANRLAHALRDMGLKREDIVCAFAPSGLNLVIMLLGIFKAGGVYMPMDIAFSKKQLTCSLKETAPRFYLVDGEWEKEVSKILNELGLAPECIFTFNDNNTFDAAVNRGGGCYKIKQPKTQAGSHENPILLSEPQDGNYIFHTSGSTGAGKAVLGCHDSLSHFIHWQLKEFNIDASCRVSQLSQHTFDASLRDILLPLCAGATLCIPPKGTKDNLTTLVQWIVNESISLIHTVPSFFRVIAREMLLANETPISLRYVFLAGEYITVQDILNWKKATDEQTEFVNLYGATEATMAKTFNRITSVSGDTTKAVHAGRPINNTVIAIVNDGNLCQPGEVGEIYIVTPFLTKGYYRDSDKTSASFVQNPLVSNRKEIVYKTGDYGYYLEDQNVFVMGRMDDQVKVNGIRVELNEVKEVVSAYPGVEETEITVHKDSYLQNSLVCYVVGPAVNTDLLKKHLETELNRNIIPSHFIKLDEFPRTINGKVDKKALPKPDDMFSETDEYEAPVNEIELKLETMCKDILSLSKVDRNISFFKIGGTSLKAMQYISRIFRELGLSVNLRDVFENESIAQLAAFMTATAVTGVYQEIPNAPEADYYQLSHAQKRLWLTDQFQDEKLRYNMTYASMLTGKLSMDILQRVADVIIARHEILRTRFAVVNGVPQQQVQPAAAMAFRVNFTDLRDLGNKKEALEEMLNDESGYSFDLEYGPLFRMSVLQTDDEEYHFVLSMHHIVSDGWSVEILVRELFELYNAFSEGRAASLTPLRLQYKDFAWWQNQQLEGEQLKNLEDYWLSQFTDEPTPVVLPADFPNNNPLFLNGGVASFNLDKSLSDKVEKLADANGASTFMVLMAIVKVLLNRYTGQQDIIAGTPAATRNHPELENQVGIYINVLPVRTRIVPENDNFRTVLHKVKEQLLGAIEHELYPYDLLIEKLGLAKQASRFPLINILIQSQFILDESLPPLAGLTVTDSPVSTLTSKVDITFNFKQTTEGISGALEYNSGMFKRTAMEQLIENLLHVTRLVTSDEKISIHAIRLLKKKEAASEEELFKQMMLSVK